MNLLERRRALMAQIKRKSKNLFNVSLIPNSTFITNNGDGSITLQGGAMSRNTGLSLRQLCPNLKVGDVATLSAVSKGTQRIATNSRAWLFGETKTLTQEMFEGKVYFYTKTTSKADEFYTISNIQIELGTKATEYEPYY